MTALQLFSRLKERQLTVSQATVLLVLGQMPLGGRFMDVANRAHISLTAASTQLSRLGDIGLVQRSGRTFMLTRAGQEELRNLLHGPKPAVRQKARVMRHQPELFSLS